jgi:hypothetical protein
MVAVELYDTDAVGDDFSSIAFLIKNPPGGNPHHLSSMGASSLNIQTYLIKTILSAFKYRI